jgi:hypothetical protein
MRSPGSVKVATGIHGILVIVLTAMDAGHRRANKARRVHERSFPSPLGRQVARFLSCG